MSPAPVRFGATPPDIHLDRLMDGLRLAVIGVVTSVGLSVGFGVGDGLAGVAAGVGSVALLIAAFMVPLVRNVLADVADRIIGR